MVNLLRAAGAAVTAFVDTLWPVDTPGFDCGLGDYTEPPLTGDELTALRQIIEERFPIPAAPTPSGMPAERPGAELPQAAQPAAPGHPNIANAIRAWADDIECADPDRYRALADEIDEAFNQIETNTTWRLS